jgi:hypothetical protein
LFALVAIHIKFHFKEPKPFKKELELKLLGQNISTNSTHNAKNTTSIEEKPRTTQKSTYIYHYRWHGSKEDELPQFGRVYH